VCGATQPLIVAAHALEAHVLLILLAMSVGRLVRWGAMYATIYSSQLAMRTFRETKDAK